jgi:hypothetical protein
VDALAVSTEPVPQFAAPPGYWVPVRSSQFAALGDVFAVPVKSSLQTVVHCEGLPVVGGVDVGGALVGGVPPTRTWSSHSE